MSELRVRKIQEFIKQEVSQMLLYDLKDPHIGFVTVTGVHVTGDLREATIYVSLFGKSWERQNRSKRSTRQKASSARNSASASRFTTHRKLPSKKTSPLITACTLKVS